MAVTLSHAVDSSIHQQLNCQNTGVGGDGVSLGVQEQHPMHPHQIEAIPSMEHVATSGIVDPPIGGSMDRHISTHNMIIPAIAPPNHIRTMLFNQYLQQSGVSQSGDYVGVITGTNLILMGHQNTFAPPHHGGLCTQPHGVGIDLYSHARLPNQGLISSNCSAFLNFSNSDSAGGMLYTQPHISLATPVNLVSNVSTTPTTQPHNIIEDL